jgi:hypothetical protein
VHIEGHRDPQPLIDPTRYPDTATIQHHLLEELIPTAVSARPPRRGGQDPLRPQRHHDPEQIRRWLTTLAIELRDAETRDWRWWELARHTFTRRQIRLAVVLVAVLMCVPMFTWLIIDRDVPAHVDFRLRGRARALGSMLAHNLPLRLVIGLVIGQLLVGLVIGWCSGWCSGWWSG